MKLFTIEDLIFNKEDFLDDINEFEDLLPIIEELQNELTYEEIECVGENDCCGKSNKNYIVEIQGFLNEEDEFITKKEIENQLRGKIAKQYTEKVAKLEDEINHLREANAEYRNRAYKAEQEKLEMQDKLNQFEDWNNRLQEFMDMSEEDRLAYVENLKKTNELNKAIEGFGFYGKMLSRVFN